MHSGAHGRDLVVCACGINTVSKKDDEKLPVGVYPDRSAGETQMPEATRGKVVAAGGIRGGNHPSKCARIRRQRLERDKLCERRTSQQALVSVDAAIEKHLAERRQIRRRGKHSS